MEQNTTHLYKLEDFDKALVLKILSEVEDALEEKGYNSVNQLVGYLMSGDPGYISNHLEARNKITKLDRAKIIEVLLREFQNREQ